MRRTKIEMEVFGEGRQRGYKFRGELSIGRLIGSAVTNTSDDGGPNETRSNLQNLKCAISLRAEGERSASAGTPRRLRRKPRGTRDLPATSAVSVSRNATRSASSSDINPRGRISPNSEGFAVPPDCRAR